VEYSKLHRREILSGMKRVARVDHIQIAAPEGCERAARAFYGSILGLQEVEKPWALHARGGCWFQCDQQQVHIGVEPGFRPAKKGTSCICCLQP
jgi:catechol 2,3-dioxygenase-like lactoylglutathione lyase family enzyme